MRTIVLIIIAIAVVGMAGAIDPVEISGKDFADFEQFNGTNAMQSEDLAGTSAAMMGLDSAFLKDNPEDGKPLGHAREPLLLGSMVGRQQQEQRYYTPAELAMIQNMAVGMVDAVVTSPGAI